MQVMPSTLSGGVLISVEYDSTGLGWCRIYDNQVLGWIVDETGAGEPQPQIIGQLPPMLAPDTAPVISPQWAVFTSPAVMIPDLWRGSFSDFLDLLATNNGAWRPIGKRLGHSVTLFNEFDVWARRNPDLVLSD
jgi:hypothetical protein